MRIFLIYRRKLRIKKLLKSKRKRALAQSASAHKRTLTSYEDIVDPGNGIPFSWASLHAR